MRAILPRHRLLSLSPVIAALLAACSVFPDEAVLPASSAGSAGSGNDSGMLSAEGGAAGESVGARPTGGAVMGGTSAGGSAGGRTGAPQGEAGTGAQQGGGGAGQGGGGGGQGGGGGGQGGGGAEIVDGGACEKPQSSVVSAHLDSWISSAAPTKNNGGDSFLYVSGGTDEHRVVLAFTIPKALAGVRWVSAELVLSLESTEDASKARSLAVWRLRSCAMQENKVTWTKCNAGNNEGSAWQTPGGDLEEFLVVRPFPAATKNGLLGFDVLGKLRTGPTSSASTYELAVVESGAAPPAPARMVLTSRESGAPGWVAPELRLSYCPP